MRRSRPIGLDLVGAAALTGLLSAGLLLAGRSTGRAQTPTASPLASPSVVAPTSSPTQGPGWSLYQADCAWCHGARGEGTTRGPTLTGVGAASADFMLRTGRMPIGTVEKQPRRTTPRYDPAQIRALTAYVASLGPGPPIPPVDPAAGDLGEGASLYAIDCAACHSSTGIGGAMTNGLQAPGLERATATEIAEAVRIGGAGVRSGNMPKFGSDVLDQHQLDSVVRYVLYLQHPRDRGGQPLGHLGPVAEGLAAWGGALLLTVAFVRWIGKRSE